MVSTSEGRKKLIKDFIYILKAVKDDRKDMHYIIDFLSMLLRHKETVPPTTEMVTILKCNKPILFQHLKKSILPSSPMHIVLQMNMDYETALNRLN
ncbi:hypothetical protein [Ferviditalea candida]|uniref:Uncharacterized protein n=1 Tax=Ferviditalea candida TaxID=3108399 RepID=A0ABU5ZNH6_9BACL|nr:hypothetical protein [Paenibacillaceae bacterium T2]